MRKDACVNVQNQTDEKCFMWSVLSALFPVDSDASEVSSYREHESTLNFEGMDFPMSIGNVSKFEMQNDISIHVFGFEEGVIFQMYISENVKRLHVNLLYFSCGEKGHYVWVKDLSRLLSSQISRHKHKMHFCLYCLHGCRSEQVLQMHQKICKQHGAQLTFLPERGDGRDVISFKKVEHQLRLPFVIYADFECILPKVINDNAAAAGDDSADKDGNDCSKKTEKISEHKPSGFAIHTVCSDSRFYREPYIYLGEDAAERFIDKVQEEVTDLRSILNNKIKMKRLTPEELQSHRMARKCYLCNGTFPTVWHDDRNLYKVRDHDHLTGTYRGAAHSICNSIQINPQTVRIPVILHNLKGYDSHPIFTAVAKRHGAVNCIPTNTEKYIGNFYLFIYLFICLFIYFYYCLLIHSFFIIF